MVRARCALALALILACDRAARGHFRDANFRRDDPDVRFRRWTAPGSVTAATNGVATVSATATVTVAQVVESLAAWRAIRAVVQRYGGRDSAPCGPGLF